MSFTLAKLLHNPLHKAEVGLGGWFCETEFFNGKLSMPKMNDPAASGGVSSFVLGRHSVLDTESRIVFWIPAFAGMTNSPRGAGWGAQSYFHSSWCPQLA